MAEFEGKINPPEEEWVDIPSIGTEMPLRGGSNGVGPMNKQAMAIAKRLNYLNKEKVNTVDLADDTDPGKGAAMVGRNVIAVDSIADLLALPEGARREDLRYLVRGYHAGSDVGGGEFYWDAALTADDNGGTVFAVPGVEPGRFERRFNGAIDVTWFGAKGDDSQILQPTSYQTDRRSAQVTVTQQTADAIAINRAISYLRERGGGALQIPRGVYRTYAYLERIDFPCTIVGDGVDQTIIKNCDASPTNTNGYGVFVVDPEHLSAVTFNNLTVDGNAEVRAQPTLEFRSYPVAFYGRVDAKVNFLKSINSPIDCFYSNYANELSSSMQVSNCTFHNSYRNTVSLVSGWNQSFVNCDISGGGKVHSGTNPRYCLDIEPNSSSAPIKNIKFTNCRFSDARNVLAGGTWCEAVFVNCEFEAIGSDVIGYPWAFNFGQSQVSLIGCKVAGNASTLRGLGKSYNTYTEGSYKETQYLRIVGCEFYACGLHIIGRRTFVENTIFMNSRTPVLIEGGLGVPKHDAYIRDITLINVIDGSNFGLGTSSAFAIKSSVAGEVDVDGLLVTIDPDTLPDTSLFQPLPTSIHGVFIPPNSEPPSEWIKLSNVHVAGYYQKLPSAFGVTPNASNYRDWNVPNTAPADTVGQIVGPGVKFYRNCTMYGDNP